MNAYPSRAKSYRIERFDPKNNVRTVIHQGISRGALWKLLDQYVAQHPNSVIQFATEVTE